MHFLVVDDDHSINQLLTLYLTRKGHRVTALADATKVSEWVGQNRCDAIILDIGMPEIDGLTLIPMIREIGGDLPIIIFTGLGYDSEAMQKALKAGANGYVSKGLPTDEVFLALQRVLGARLKNPKPTA